MRVIEHFTTLFVVLQATACLAVYSGCTSPSITSSLKTLSGQATDPLQFCQFYMLEDRYLSPFSQIPVEPLKAACSCMIKASSTALTKTSSTVKTSSHTPTSTVGPSASCNAANVQAVKKAYKSYQDFCTFYVSVHRIHSAIASMTPGQIVNACNCILRSAASSSHSSTLVKSSGSSKSGTTTTPPTSSASYTTRRYSLSQTATSIPSHFSLQGLNYSYVPTGVTSGDLLVGSGGAGGTLAFDKDPILQNFTMDPYTGILYSGGYPVTISYDGYIEPSLTTFSGYPYVTSLYGQTGFRLLTCAVDPGMLLHCGVEATASASAPYGYIDVKWWCGVGFYGTQVGCFLSAGYETDPAGEDPSTQGYATLDLKVVAN